ncbi:MAG: RNA polymerase sporulation sigma factor SigE [Clostridia bacterium]|nr:RNA polymerase sporulation sigma factor SigE [Clostridia bacterium]
MNKTGFSLFARLFSLIEKFRVSHSVNYINGSETLPPPLSACEECDVIEQLAHDPENARQTLIEHNLRLVVFIAKKFESTGIGIEDLISIGTIGLIKAINTFKADKNIKLATYASRCIENEILMFIRKNSQLRTEMSIDEPLSVDWDGNELLLSDILCSDSDSVFSDLEIEEDKRIIRRALFELTERERVIISLRFGLNGAKERTQKEVADMLGISQSYISRLEKRIIADLKDKLEAKY